MNMKKSLIALTVASAFVAPAAMAEATVYGVAHVTIDRVNNGATTSSTTNQLNSRQSRLGFKGSEVLGGGLSAIWQMEGSVAMDTGTTALFDRDIFIGVKSTSMGTALVGRHDTPYKIATRSLDAFADTAADNRSVMGAVHDVRHMNVLAYTSPAMSGLTIAAATVFGAETALSGNTKGSLTSLAAMYTMDQLYATLAVQNIKYGSMGTGDLAGVVGNKADAMKLGVGYTMDQFAVNLVYENAKSTVALTGVDTKGTNMYLAGKYNISSTNAVKLAYAKAGDTKAAGFTTNNGTKQMSLGYDHSMSKNTTVYALYTKLTNSTSGTRGSFGTTANGSVANSDPSVISLGMKHSF